MDKVKPGSITETFGFSRALHLMENSGERVRSLDYAAGRYLFVTDGALVGFDEGELWDLNGYEYYAYYRFIDPGFVMGNWEIYREEIHGAK